jgi:hypothetical protein
VKRFHKVKLSTPYKHKIIGIGLIKNRHKILHQQVNLNIFISIENKNISINYNPFKKKSQFIGKLSNIKNNLAFNALIIFSKATL